MNSTIDKSVDVLVVGGGGCGLAISIFLADKGVDFLTIERHASTSILPKAHYLNQRTMEIFRQHGLADEVFAKGTPPYNRSRTKWYTSLGGDNPLAGKTIFEMGALGGHGTPRIVHYLETSPTDTSNLPQIRLEPLIKSHAESRDASRIRFSCELVEFSQDAEGVTAKLRDVNTNQTETVRAKYLVAADGGRTVGKTLGVAMEGPTKLITQISVHFEADLSQWIPDDRVLLNWLKPMHRQGVSVVVPMGPDKWGRNSPEWSLGFPRMPFDPPSFGDEAAADEVRKILAIADLPVKVRCVSEWAVEGVLAERYRVGRIFLAGDAAHRHPPTTGLGLNTGIQDAHNLAWKLALATEGKAGDRLLDSYEAERRPVGAFNVEWALNAFFNHMLLEMGVVAVHPNNLDGGADVRPRDRRGAGPIRRHREWSHAPRSIGDNLRHAGDRVFRPRRRTRLCLREFRDRDRRQPPPRRDPPMVSCTRRPRARAIGCPIVGSTNTARNCRHMILRAGERSSCSSSEAKAKLGAPPRRRPLPATGAKIKTIVVGRGGDVLDAEARWSELSGTHDDGAVLVRPDNMVAWRSASLPHDASAQLTRCFLEMLRG